MHRIQIDNVVLALAEHQDSNLVLDLLVAALGATASLQEFGSEMQTGILVYCPANGRKFAPRKRERQRDTHGLVLAYTRQQKNRTAAQIHCEKYAAHYAMYLHA